MPWLPSAFSALLLPSDTGGRLDASSQRRYGLTSMAWYSQCDLHTALGNQISTGCRDPSVLLLRSRCPKHWRMRYTMPRPLKPVRVLPRTTLTEAAFEQLIAYVV